MGYIKSNKVFGSQDFKQGVKRKPTVKVVDNQEYEEYIDPDCGCKKIRVKKIKTEENETDVQPQPEQVRTELEVKKQKRSRKSDPQ